MTVSRWMSTLMVHPWIITLDSSWIVFLESIRLSPEGCLRLWGSFIDSAIPAGYGWHPCAKSRISSLSQQQMISLVATERRHVWGSNTAYDTRLSPSLLCRCRSKYLCRDQALAVVYMHLRQVRCFFEFLCVIWTGKYSDLAWEEKPRIIEVFLY